MLNFSRIFSKVKLCEGKERIIGIYGIISSELINYLTNMCWSCPLYYTVFLINDFDIIICECTLKVIGLCFSMAVTADLQLFSVGKRARVSCFQIHSTLGQFHTNHIIFRNVDIFKKNLFTRKNKIPKENKSSDEIFENISLVIEILKSIDYLSDKHVSKWPR